MAMTGAMAAKASAALPETTLVLDVLATDPTWGQESPPGWPVNFPVKDAPGYSLYDIAINRDSAEAPTSVAMYKWSGTVDTQTEQQFRAGLVRKVDVSGAALTQKSSTNVLKALEREFAIAISRSSPSRIIVSFSGHGSPQVFFDETLLLSDSRKLLAYVRAQAPKATVVLDTSTNCNNGFYEFAALYPGLVDYIVASEKEVGGFSIDNATIDQWLKIRNPTVFDQVWRSTNTTSKSLETLVSNDRKVWELELANIQVAGINKEQSISVYDMHHFNSFIRAMKSLPSPSISNVMSFPNNDYSDSYPAYDIGAYVLSQGNANLQSSFTKFRIYYSSTQDLVPWTDDTKGFSIFGSDLGAL